MAFENPELGESVPSYVYDDTLKKLTVRGVSEFPREIFEFKDAIEILDMSNNQLNALPEELKDLSKLRVAFFSGNKFQEVPPQLALCENLEMVGLKSCGIERVGDFVLPVGLQGLILTDNLLTVLPDSLGQYAHLKKLMLTGNQLISLPSTLANLKELELVRLAGNRLESEPSWLADLPKLSWYADSDNAFNSINTLSVPFVREFAVNDVALGRKLGESSKNIVYAAALNTGEDVAVKIFGKGVTTDGSADNEIIAALIAGAHSNLVGARGRLVHSDGIGLVMSLVPENYKPLGSPPDLVDYTRDSYEQDGLSLSAVIAIAQCISKGLEHLHLRGVMHGDVYAHNVLYSPEGDSKLCDFGAATIYDRSSPAESWREKIDVAGYGRLIDELLQQVHTVETQRDVVLELTKLVSACLHEDTTNRPTFEEINGIIANYVH